METLFETDKCKFWIVKNFSEDLYKVMSQVELEIKPEIKVYGKVCHQQRDVGFFSDESSGYIYSKQKTKSRPMTKEMKELMEKVNEYLGTKFNGILVNKYNNGNEYLSAHSDSEVGLDRDGIVAGISYGAVRKFRIREKKTKKIVLDYDHEPCSLIVMDNKTEERLFQETYTHEIPIQKKVKESRISLTFRTHVN